MIKIKEFFSSKKVQKGLVIGGAILTGIYILGRIANSRGDEEEPVSFEEGLTEEIVEESI